MNIDFFIGALVGNCIMVMVYNFIPIIRWFIRRYRARWALASPCGMPTTIRERVLHGRCEAVLQARKDFVREHAWMLHDLTPTMTTSVMNTTDFSQLAPGDLFDLDSESTSSEGDLAAFEQQLEKNFHTGAKT